MSAAGQGSDRELVAVAHVYAELVRLRRAPNPPAPLAALRALAAELPGALRILDQMPLELLVERAEAVGALQSGGGDPLPAWVEATLAWRRTMQAVLAARRVARSGPAAEPAGAEVNGAAGLRAPRPPGGRLVAWALGELSVELGRPADAIEREIFGPVCVSALDRLARR